MFDRMKLFNNSAPLWRPVAFCVAAVGDIFGRSNYDIHARVFCFVFLGLVIWSLGGGSACV